MQIQKTTRKYRVPVMVESPFAGDVLLNVKYAQLCMIDSLNRCEAPALTHLLYTQVLEDDSPVQREIGMECHSTWIEKVDIVAIYMDLGLTRGMRQAIEKASGKRRTTFRYLFGELTPLAEARELVEQYWHKSAYTPWFKEPEV